VVDGIPGLAEPAMVTSLLVLSLGGLLIVPNGTGSTDLLKLDTMENFLGQFAKNHQDTCIRPSHVPLRLFAGHDLLSSGQQGYLAIVLCCIVGTL